MPCVFCDLLAGRRKATVVHRDASVVAFMDIQPVTPGHLLVVPVAHYVGLGDLPAEVGAAMFDVARRMAAALRRSDIHCEGVNLFFADGEAAGQEVFHAHLHVIPRFSGDGFGLRMPEGHTDLPTRGALEQVAATIRASIAEV